MEYERGEELGELQNSAPIGDRNDSLVIGLNDGDGKKKEGEESGQGAEQEGKEGNGSEESTYPWPEKDRREGDCPCCATPGESPCSIEVRWQRYFDDEYEGNPTQEQKDTYRFRASGKIESGRTQFFAQIFAVVEIAGLPADQLENCHLVQDVIVQEKRVGDREHTTEVTPNDYHPDRENKNNRGHELLDWPGRNVARPRGEFDRQVEWFFFLARVYILECPDIEYFWGFQMRADWSRERPRLHPPLPERRFRQRAAPPNPFIDESGGD